MTRGIHVDPSDATPIWSQIEEGVRRLVASGALPAGSPIPSVRELARDLSVNPATVVRAYQRLTDAGILSVKRGEGTFVSERPPKMSRGERAKILREAAARYATFAATIGADRNEAGESLDSAWAALSDGAKGEKR
jgi:GntR family transcriptional regulator